MPRKKKPFDFNSLLPTATSARNAVNIDLILAETERLLHFLSEKSHSGEAQIAFVKQSDASFVADMSTTTLRLINEYWGNTDEVDVN